MRVAGNKYIRSEIPVNFIFAQHIIPDKKTRLLCITKKPCFVVQYNNKLTVVIDGHYQLLLHLSYPKLRFLRFQKI